MTELIKGRSVAVRAAMALLIASPAVVLRVLGIHPGPLPSLLIFGVGVLAAAILLMWSAETARADMSGALAIAVLALIAVLPEYAVDLYYAYRAGSDPAYTAYAAANMTGANRLLVGVGWALVVLAFALGVRARGRHTAAGRQHRRDVHLLKPHRIELGFLALAAVVGFVPALVGEIGWYITIPLLGIYLWYVLTIARGARDEESQATGVPAYLVELAKRPRIAVTWTGFALGAVVIFCSAEPFAESLVATGTEFGIDEFLLVQWLAPLASEAPELIVAGLYAWRLRDDDAIGALLSSKVNQWTLLVGTLPFAYRAGGGEWSLPLDARQSEEILLTAAQTVLGLALLIDLYFKRWEAAVLFGLFAVQFVLPDTHARLLLAYVYLVIGFTLLIMKRRDLGLAMQAVVRPPR